MDGKAKQFAAGYEKLDADVMKRFPLVRDGVCSAYYECRIKDKKPTADCVSLCGDSCADCDAFKADFKKRDDLAGNLDSAEESTRPMRLYVKAAQCVMGCNTFEDDATVVTGSCTHCTGPAKEECNEAACAPSHENFKDSKCSAEVGAAEPSAALVETESDSQGFFGDFFFELFVWAIVACLFALIAWGLGALLIALGVKASAAKPLGGLITAAIVIIIA